MWQDRHALIGGIDYGSKLAGTTVLACGNTENRTVSVYESKPRQDADLFLLETIRKLQIRMVFLDAPLSLPGIYRALPGCSDYFYRAADRTVQAMSPMFLGGLTARAIRLRDLLTAEGVAVFETYPSAQSRRMQLHEWEYKKSKTAIARVLERLQILVPEWTFPPSVNSWHEMDALLALIGAYRFSQGIHEQAGNETEGMIYW